MVMLSDVGALGGIVKGNFMEGGRNIGQGSAEEARSEARRSGSRMSQPHGGEMCLRPPRLVAPGRDEVERRVVGR